MMRRGTVLIGFLHPAAPANYEIAEMLRDRDITSLTTSGEILPRSRNQ